MKESEERGDLAIVLSGGGARAAYQVGVLRGIARHLPELRFPIVIGVSAGAINAAYLAAHPGNLRDAMDEFAVIWAGLRVEDIFRLDNPSVAQNLFTWLRWAARFSAGEPILGPEIQGFVDTEPLRATIRNASAVVDGEIIALNPLSWAAPTNKPWSVDLDMATSIIAGTVSTMIFGGSLRSAASPSWVLRRAARLATKRS